MRKFLFTCMLCASVSCMMFTSCSNRSTEKAAQTDSVVVDSIDSIECDSALTDSL